MKPIIGITCNVIRKDPERPYYRNKELHYCEASLSHAVSRAGGIPVLLPVPEDESAARDLLDVCDGLILSPGLDMNPELSGAVANAQYANWCETLERDRFEIALVGRFREAARPILGICRGIQVLGVAEGGTLLSDLGSMRAGDASPQHRHSETYDRNRHEIVIEADSRIAALIGSGRREVVSVHHQAIDRVPEGLQVVARADDGVVEAVEAPGQPFVVGVQWHPEWMPGEEAGDGLFRGLVAEAVRSRA